MARFTLEELVLMRDLLGAVYDPPVIRADEKLSRLARKLEAWIAVYRDRDTVRGVEPGTSTDHL